MELANFACLQYSELSGLAVVRLAGMNNQGRKRNSVEKSGKVRKLARDLSRGKLILFL